MKYSYKIVIFLFLASLIFQPLLSQNVSNEILSSEAISESRKKDTELFNTVTIPDSSVNVEKLGQLD